MNERIRKLAVEAGIDFFSSIDPEFNGKEFCEAWTEQQQKFTELIIRKCMNLVKDCYAEPESDQSQYQTVCASTIIEEYFGVEE